MMACDQKYLRVFSILFLTVFVTLFTAGEAADDNRTFNEENEAKFQEYRQKIKDLKFEGRIKDFPNTTFARNFFEGFDYKIDEAFEGVKRVLQWRKDNDVENILNETTFSSSQLPYDLSSRDKDGRPILLVQIRNWDFRKIYVLGQTKKFERFAIQIIETILTQINEKRAQGIDLASAVSIFDWSGYNVKQHQCPACVELQFALLKLVDNNYRGCIKHWYHINVPVHIEQVFKRNRVILSKSANHALEIHGQGQSKWKDTLLSSINADQLLVQYGGSKHAK